MATMTSHLAYLLALIIVCSAEFYPGHRYKTTPRGGDGVTDDIIFSGIGSGCQYDDEEDCTHSGPTSPDAIISPIITYITTTPSPTTPRTKGDDDIAGSGSDPCDDEEDCGEGSGTHVDAVFTTKTTTDDIIIINTQEPDQENKIAKDTVSDTQSPRPSHVSTTDSMFFTQNITEKPTRKTPIITTQRTKHDSGHTSTSRGGVVGITYNGEGGHVKQANPLSLNIGLIVGIAAGVVLLLLILAYVLYKYKSRDEGSYKIDESKNYSYEAYTATEAKPSSGTQTNGGVVKTTCVPASKPKKKDVKEWYV